MRPAKINEQLSIIHAHQRLAAVT